MRRKLSGSNVGIFLDHGRDMYKCASASLKYSGQSKSIKHHFIEVDKTSSTSKMS